MTREEILKQAEYIFNASRMIRVHLAGMRTTHEKKTEKDNKDSELTMSQVFALTAVDEHGCLTVKELSKLLGISSPSTTVIIDNMVKKGMFTREHSEEDRRKVIVQIAPAFSDKVNYVKKLYMQTIIDLIHKIGPETTRKWCEVVSEIKRAIKE